MSTYSIIENLREMIAGEKKNISSIGEKCGTWEDGFFHGRLYAFQICLELCYIYGVEEDGNEKN